MKSTRRWIRVLGTALLILPFVMFAGCSDDNGAGPTVSEFDVIAEAGRDFLGAGTAAAVASSAVWADVNGAQNMFLLDVRGAADYAAGHVEGAVNVPWREIAKQVNQGVFPASKTDEIVVICYTGHTASQTAMYLGTQGYTKATAMKWGMTSWDIDELSTSHYDYDSHCGEYPMVAAAPAVSTHAFPALDYTSATDDTEIIRAAADSYLSAGKSPAVASSSVWADVNGAGEMFLIDIRGSSDYFAGHVTGAINIPFRTHRGRGESGETVNRPADCGRRPIGEPDDDAAEHARL